MSNNAIATQGHHEITDDQMRIIKATVAKSATNDELALFLYRCKHMGLDPLRPGHIHFIKYGNNPGTIVIGIDGFRSKAAKTNKHSGTKRGLLHNTEGECIGAWAEVYRSDWAHPAREEVSLREYNTGKGNWLKMPETMIRKVAEVAALRMAFPDDLGGLYSDDEMENVSVESETPRVVSSVPKKESVLPTSQDTWETYVIPFGKYKNMRMSEQTVYEIKDYRAYIERSAFEKKKDITGAAAVFCKFADEYIAARSLDAQVRDAYAETQDIQDEFDRKMQEDNFP